MKILLDPSEKIALKKQHKTERDKRICDRIKAIIMLDDGWDLQTISKVLLIHEETVRTHLEEYLESKKLKPENKGSKSDLNEENTHALIAHLEEHTYHKVADICAFVLKTFKVFYTVSGMTDWLHRHKFSYKGPKKVPVKADPIAQAKWIQFYGNLMNTTPEDEPIEFGDGVHPTMVTKVTSGWIRTGIDKPIATTASRSRLNLFGSINLETMDLTINAYKTINSQSMEEHFKKLKSKYVNAPLIHLILDNGPYNKSFETQEAARKYGIKLHFLPTYSPNLNPIERVWKVANEHVRNNVFFKSVKEFRIAMMTFFHKTWNEISMTLVSRINDNFQTLLPAISC